MGILRSDLDEKEDDVTAPLPTTKDLGTVDSNTVTTTTRLFAVLDDDFVYTYMGSTYMYTSGTRFKIGSRYKTRRMFDGRILVDFQDGSSLEIPQSRYHLEEEVETVTRSKTVYRL